MTEGDKGRCWFTGRVHEPDEVVRLAQHACGNGVVKTSISPLLADQLADVLGGNATERLFNTLAHLPIKENRIGPDMERDTTLMRSPDIFDWKPPDLDSRPATCEDLPDVDLDNDTGILDEEDEDVNETADSGNGDNSEDPADASR